MDSVSTEDIIQLWLAGRPVDSNLLSLPVAMDLVLTDDLDQLETKLGRLETLCSVNRVMDNAITNFFQALYEHDYWLNVDPGHVSADSGKDVYLA